MATQPPPLAVAAALRVLRIKPGHLSVSGESTSSGHFWSFAPTHKTQDFIDRLRQCAPKPTNNHPHSDSTPGPRLDWRRRCIISESREDELSNQLFERDRELARLKAEAAPVQKPSKRKRGQENAPLPNTRLGVDQSQSASPDAEWLKLEQEVRHVGGSGTSEPSPLTTPRRSPVMLMRRPRWQDSTPPPLRSATVSVRRPSRQSQARSIARGRLRCCRTLSWLYSFEWPIVRRSQEPTAEQ